MTTSDQLRERRHQELSECYAVIDTCLAAYYAGAKHMYRPLAGQLRILLCDKLPLLTRVFPTFAIGALRPIEWAEVDKAPLFDDEPLRLAIQHPPGQEFRLARMPFLITEYENGLQVADIEIASDGALLQLDEWMEQNITLHPTPLSLRETIRSIADKGGGAHVDDNVNSALAQMFRTGPAGVGSHVLFSIAIGRLAQKVGLHCRQFLEKSGHHGELADFVFDREHPTVLASAQVSAELRGRKQHQYALTLLMRTR